jgi:hypothetical protein
MSCQNGFIEGVVSVGRNFRFVFPERGGSKQLSFSHYFNTRIQSIINLCSPN